MYAKVATLVTLVVLIAQPNAVKAVLYSTNPTSNAIISNFITSANNTLQAAVTQTAMIANKFYTDLKAFEAQVQGNVNAILAQVDQMVATEVYKIGGLPAKIYNCTKLQKPALDAYAQSTFNNITGCVTEKIVQGINSVNNIFNSLAAEYVIVTNASNRINAVCPQPTSSDFFVGLNHIGCVTGVVTQISLELAGHTLTITSNIATLSILIADIPNFPVQFTTCITTRSTAALVNALPIAGNIAVCTLTA